MLVSTCEKMIYYTVLCAARCQTVLVHGCFSVSIAQNLVLRGRSGLGTESLNAMLVSHGPLSPARTSPSKSPVA